MPSRHEPPKPESTPKGPRVRDAHGHAGHIAGELDDGVLVRLEDGRNVLLPAEALRAERDGSYTVGFDLVPDADASEPRSSGTIPVLSEELAVERRTHVTGGVRLHKHVTERIARVDEPIVRERVTVERVPVNRPVLDGRIPTVREHDGLLIVPLIEEVLVVEKRLMVREELHVRRIREETRDRREVPLRREHVDVERFDTDAPKGREH
jgi:uncharacterized protein (TIGR02271 family)